jgi:NadR type nicotinamide-nucleotide adenylyltransferase
MKKTGLFLGKFAPLHKGHQMVIETALREVDLLYILIYPSDLTDIPLPVRANWIRALYPKVKVIEGWDGPQDEGDSDEVKALQERYILKVLNGIKISHFYSSEFYGEHVSLALGAIDRRIDEARYIVPVSGTALREDAFKGRAFISDVVYRDLVTKVCFMGAPSTGKTTLSKVLAKKFDTEFMAEYGAEYWIENQVDRRLNIHQFEEISVEHNKREDDLVLRSNKYLFCDTSPITTYIFAMDYLKAAGPVLTRLANESSSRYDLFFLCDTDIPYDDTWDRSGAGKTLSMQTQIIDDLNMRRIPFLLVSGTVDQRIAQVSRVLEQYRKFV